MTRQVTALSYEDTVRLVENIGLKLKVAKRGIEQRGGSIIANKTESNSSGAHSDPDPGCLICCSGQRTVWFATNIPDKVLRRSTGKLGMTRHLPDDADLTITGVKSCSVEWSCPITLNPGDAILIPRSICHLIGSSPHSVGLVIEIGPNDMTSEHPRFKKHFCKPEKLSSALKALVNTNIANVNQ